MHDASCRDRGDPAAWLNTGVTIQEYRTLREQGQMPFGWESYYNEHLIQDSVPVHRIVSYAKVEKELPIDIEMSSVELDKVKSFINDNLNFATQFDRPEDNVLLHETDGKYQFRISFNRENALGRQQEISAFFNQFSSISQLVKAATNDQTLNNEERQAWHRNLLKQSSPPVIPDRNHDDFSKFDFN